MSPLGINILLHFWCSPSPYVHPPSPDKYPEAVKDFLLMAENHDLLRDQSGDGVPVHESVFKLTSRGDAFVERLLNTPLPRKVETWVFDDGGDAE
jgi:hypothetical protein